MLLCITISTSANVIVFLMILNFSQYDLVNERCVNTLIRLWTPTIIQSNNPINYIIVNHLIQPEHTIVRVDTHTTHNEDVSHQK